MTTNPKIPRQSFKKYPMNRAEAAQIFFQRRNIQVEFYSGNSFGEKGKIVRKLFERIVAVTWFIIAC